MQSLEFWKLHNNVEKWLLCFHKHLLWVLQKWPQKLESDLYSTLQSSCAQLWPKYPTGGLAGKGQLFWFTGLEISAVPHTRWEDVLLAGESGGRGCFPYGQEEAERDTQREYACTGGSLLFPFSFIQPMRHCCHHLLPLLTWNACTDTPRDVLD